MIFLSEHLGNLMLIKVTTRELLKSQQSCKSQQANLIPFCGSTVNWVTGKCLCTFYLLTCDNSIWHCQKYDNMFSLEITVKSVESLRNILASVHWQSERNNWSAALCNIFITIEGQVFVDNINQEDYRNSGR